MYGRTVEIAGVPRHAPIWLVGDSMGNFRAPDTPGGASSHGVRFSKLTNVAAALIMINFSINLLRFDGNNY